MKSWNVLKSGTEYKKALKRTMEIFESASGSTDEKELDLLLVLIKDYEDKHVTLPDLNPIEVIKMKMEEEGLKAKDLESLIGSRGHISSVLSGRRELTLPMAQRLKNYFQLPAEVFLSQSEGIARKKLNNINKSPSKKVVRLVRPKITD